ncbi:transposase [Ohtaekwangia koreensis]|nr:transposase [Ohtaekwangia koreensis]
MSVRKEITEYSGIYFITFTCCQWLPLFEICNGYDSIYKWFDYLKRKGHYITGYVIMPNHIHALLAFRNTQGQSINAIIGNGKRFIAYELIAKLKEQANDDILDKLSSSVKKNERLRGKLHEVFEPSFDWKECSSDKFLQQKLNYIHENPCRGKWNLVQQSQDYMHSSAQYYISGNQGIYLRPCWCSSPTSR